MKRLGLLSLMALLAGLLTTGVVGAQVVNPPSVTTQAEVPASAGAPVIVNAFMLPDMDDSDNGATINLQDPYEDDPTATYVSVTPHLYNSPRSFMGFWALLTAPAGGIGSINDVWVDVFHPDGTFKYQVHMTRVSSPDLATCTALLDPRVDDTPADGAVTTGQKTSPDFLTANTGYLEQCTQGLLAVYFAKAEITKDQPFGDYSYRVAASALGGGTGVSAGSFYFTVLQIAGLAIDFSTVNFGQINPQFSTILDGDNVWGPSLPSIASVGNVWLNLKVDFDPLAGTTPGALNFGKVIDMFDVTLGYADATANPLDQARATVDPIPVQANGSTADAVTVPFILPADCPTKVQFSVHPELLGPVRNASGQSSVPVGPYNGILKLTGLSSGAQWTAGWEALLDQCRVAIAQ